MAISKLRQVLLSLSIPSKLPNPTLLVKLVCIIWHASYLYSEGETQPAIPACNCQKPNLFIKYTLMQDQPFMIEVVL